MGEAKRPLLVIGGPTASGKTALSVALARCHGGEVVSADSMQMYRGMDIATAKPTPGERAGVPHHLLDILDPGQSFSVAEFASLARPVIDGIQSRGALPVLAGGTGLYISAIVDNLQFSPTAGDPALRQELYGIAQKEGNEALHRMLEEADPQAAAGIHPNNVGRVARALEIWRLTGKTMAQTAQASRTVPSPYRACVIALDFRDREELYRRIGLRVDRMLADGLVEEARALLGAGLSSTAAQAIGYKELARYFSGEETLEEAVERIKRETRHYAKRQLTWFRKVAGVRWLYVDDYPDGGGLLAAAEETARQAGLFV